MNEQTKNSLENLLGTFTLLVTDLHNSSLMLLNLISLLVEKGIITPAEGKKLLGYGSPDLEDKKDAK